LHRVIACRIGPIGHGSLPTISRFGPAAGQWYERATMMAADKR
jgi:hypothetical protein